MHLEIKNLHTYYWLVHMLKGVSLNVNEGEIIDEVLYKALDEFGYLSGESRTVQTSAIPIIFSVFLVLYVLLWR